MYLSIAEEHLLRRRKCTVTPTVQKMPKGVLLIHLSDSLDNRPAVLSIDESELDELIGKFKQAKKLELGEAA